jgi:hypothetical protein
MEFEEEVVLLVLLHKKLNKKKRKHKFWIHPLLNARQERDMFYTAFNDLRNDESKFFNYFRMSIVSFDELVQQSYDPLRRSKDPQNELQTAGMLTIRRRSATEHARANGIISDNVPLAMARQNCGPPGRGDKRPTAFVALRFLKLFYVETRPL